MQHLHEGTMVGLQHARATETLWLTPDHQVLARLRPRHLGGKGGWTATPLLLRERPRELRREPSPPEYRLWQALRRRSIGVKFRRQHPVGRYITDFYSHEACLVVEVDGREAHSGEEAVFHDQERDAYMRALGLEVLRVPAMDVMHHLETVVEAVATAVQARLSPDGAEWVQADALRERDIVFFGRERQGVPLTNVLRERAAEPVFNLEVEYAHSFLTEVCIVHNCNEIPMGTTQLQNDPIR